MIGRSGERWSGISVLAARHDDDDDIYIHIYIHLYIYIYIYAYILDETDCISHSTNTIGKGMNPIILPPAMGK